MYKINVYRNGELVRSVDVVHEPYGYEEVDGWKCIAITPYEKDGDIIEVWRKED